MNARKWVEKAQKDNEKKGLEKFKLVYHEFTSKEGENLCYIELQRPGAKFPYVGRSTILDTKYKSVFNGLY